jgi:hypothetical protein
MTTTETIWRDGDFNQNILSLKLFQVAAIFSLRPCGVSTGDSRGAIARYAHRTDKRRRTASK